MVGTGKDEQDIERYAASLNLSDHVCFTGQVRDRDLLCGIYLNADLLFFPSVFDNAPLVLREAAVLAVPTLAAEGSNAAGAIRKNVSGFTAAADPKSMYDELVRIFSEEDVKKIGQNARELIPLVLHWEYWVAYLIALVLSVVWNFTLNREFTFRSANNVPVAMLKVAAYYAVFTPVTTVLGNYLEGTCGWNGMLVTVMNMLLNFVTEYLYDRFVVFGKSIDTNSRARSQSQSEGNE